MTSAVRTEKYRSAAAFHVTMRRLSVTLKAGSCISSTSNTSLFLGGVSPSFIPISVEHASISARDLPHQVFRTLARKWIDYVIRYRVTHLIMFVYGMRRTTSHIEALSRC